MKVYTGSCVSVLDRINSCSFLQCHSWKWWQKSKFCTVHWFSLSWHYLTVIFQLRESFSKCFPVCFPADLGELRECHPTCGALREGDRERGREPVTEGHAVQPGPAAHLHADGQTGEHTDTNIHTECAALWGLNKWHGIPFLQTHESREMMAKRSRR